MQTGWALGWFHLVCKICESDDSPHPVHKFPNRMRSTQYPSGLQSFLTFEHPICKICEPDDPPHLVHKFPNRMRSTQYRSSLQFFLTFENRMGWHPVHIIHTGWHPPPLHPVLILRTARLAILQWSENYILKWFLKI